MHPFVCSLVVSLPIIFNRDVEEMMRERGLEVAHLTVFR